MSRQINLFNPRLVARRDVLSARNLGLALLGVSAVGVAAAAALHTANMQSAARVKEITTTAQELQTRMAAITKQLSEHKPDAHLLAQLNEAEALLKGRREVERVLADHKVGSGEGFAQHLRAFARQASPALWLTGVRLDSAGLLEIRGRTLDAAQVPVYVRRLNGEPVFQGRSFAMLHMRAVDRSAPASAAPAPAPAPQPPVAALDGLALAEQILGRERANAARTAAAQPARQTAAAKPGLTRYVEFELTSREGESRGLP